MGMAVIRFPLFLLGLVSVWTHRGDAELCVLKENCILECSFPSGNDVVIHWIQMPNTPVHSFYHNQDQLARQDQRFKGRTSLFRNQISNRNASLQLSNVMVRDQGRYKCYTSTNNGNQESFVDLNVEAPIHKVNIQKVGNVITCSSEGIFPAPKLTWTVTPSSSVNIQNTTTVQPTDEQLYNVDSTLKLTDADADLTYTCTVSTSTSRGKATLLESSLLSSCSSETTLHCGFPDKHHAGLVWTFNRSQRILNQMKSGAPVEVSEQWKQHVKGVSESGSLILKDLSSEQEGTYTCELNNDEGTHVNITAVTTVKDCSNNVGKIVAAVLVPIVIIVPAAFFVWRWWKKRKGSGPY